MTKKITAAIEFSFKGQTLKPSVKLDLDAVMKQHGTIPPLHSLLATLHNIDSYSYEYEMLEAEDIIFSDPGGVAEQFFNNSKFDQTGFEKYWHESNVLDKLNQIIKTQLDIDDIHQHPALKNVLLAAYEYGKKA